MMKRARALLLLLVVLPVGMAGCATRSQPAVFRQAAPPQVLSACSSKELNQARWLQANMLRVRPGTDRNQTVNLLGNPVQVESFSLPNDAVIEVFFYPSIASACPTDKTQAAESHLIPFVFQNGILKGYGQNYYRNAVLPRLQGGAQGFGNNQANGATSGSFMSPSMGQMGGQPMGSYAPMVPAMVPTLMPTFMPTFMPVFGTAYGANYQGNQTHSGRPLSLYETYPNGYVPSDSPEDPAWAEGQSSYGLPTQTQPYQGQGYNGNGYPVSSSPAEVGRGQPLR